MKIANSSRSRRPIYSFNSLSLSLSTYTYILALPSALLHEARMALKLLGNYTTRMVHSSLHQKPQIDNPRYVPCKVHTILAICDRHGRPAGRNLMNLDESNAYVSILLYQVQCQNGRPGPLPSLFSTNTSPIVELWTRCPIRAHDQGRMRSSCMCQTPTSR